MLDTGPVFAEITLAIRVGQIKLKLECRDGRKGFTSGENSRGKDIVGGIHWLYLET